MATMAVARGPNVTLNWRPHAATSRTRDLPLRPGLDLATGHVRQMAALQGDTAATQPAQFARGVSRHGQQIITDSLIAFKLAFY